MADITANLTTAQIQQVHSKKTAVLNRIRMDETFQERDFTRFVAFVYHSRCRKSDTSFNQFFGAANALADLRAHVAIAATAKVVSVATWGVRCVERFTPRDYDRLALELVDYRRFNAPASGRPGRGRNFAAEGEQRSLRAKSTAGLYKRNFSMSLWLSPLRLPSGKQPDRLLIRTAAW